LHVKDNWIWNKIVNYTVAVKWLMSKSKYLKNYLLKS
jgi:hypothetical protein